jgi:hypothetical protein
VGQGVGPEFKPQYHKKRKKKKKNDRGHSDKTVKETLGPLGIGKQL